MTETRGDSERMDELLERLLVKDVDAHEAALAELAEVGDERVVPHLVEVVYLDTVANGWEKFGFPEVYREKDPPIPLTHPEVRWPGVIDALCGVADPDYDDPESAWLKWESWYTTHADEVQPLAGTGAFLDWKTRFYRSYHPLVGHLLDQEPAVEEFHRIRWGSCDRSTLHPLNGPDWIGAGEADYLRDEDLVYGFEVDGRAYAAPRFLVFPHEMVNAELGGVPVCVSLCTMCNSPILYDRRVELDGAERTLGFGSTGLIWQGNKAMYDEETASLWNQQTGRPIAGEMLERHRSLAASGDGGENGGRGRDDDGGVTLDFLPITQTEWDEWVAEHPDTLALSPDTGYDFDYDYYRDYRGFVKRHYWENPSAIHPGVPPGETELDDKTYVYGVETAGGVHVFPKEAVAEHEPVVDDLDDRDVVAVLASGDVGVYEAPPLPVERDGDHLVDAEGRRWRIRHDGLHAADGDDRLARVPGRHGLWLSFRPHYEQYRVVTGAV